MIDEQKLAMLIHKAWREGMISQGRIVEYDRMNWETLPARDKELDRYIASRVIRAITD